jgi:hypothetical protein
MSKNILQIPLPGGSGQARTGAVQFQDDWPGLFIRGDDAIAVLHEIREVQQALVANNVNVAVFGSKLDQIARIIERDVIGNASSA